VPACAPAFTSTPAGKERGGLRREEASRAGPHRRSERPAAVAEGERRRGKKGKREKVHGHPQVVNFSSDLQGGGSARPDFTHAARWGGERGGDSKGGWEGEDNLPSPSSTKGKKGSLKKKRGGVSFPFPPLNEKRRKGRKRKET